MVIPCQKKKSDEVKQPPMLLLPKWLERSRGWNSISTGLGTDAPEDVIKGKGPKETKPG